MYRNIIIDSTNSIINSNNNKIKYNYLFQKNNNFYIIKYTNKDLEVNKAKIEKEIIKSLKKLYININNNSTTLIIGLGNSSIIGDSLGNKTISKLIATNHYDNFLTIPKVALFTPEVISKTGISSRNIIKMLVNDLKPSTIIFIDSLKTKDIKNLDYTIELNDCGIIPGSSLNNPKEITKDTFNIPVLSIGVPLFIEKNKLLYTSLDIKNIVEETSQVIASSLNKYFFH